MLNHEQECALALYVDAVLRIEELLPLIFGVEATLLHRRLGVVWAVFDEAGRPRGFMFGVRIGEPAYLCEVPCKCGSPREALDRVKEALLRTERNLIATNAIPPHEVVTLRVKPLPFWIWIWNRLKGLR